MYRNYMHKGMNCTCNNCTCDKKEADLMENICEGVQNMMESTDMCECGFDEEENLFPNNPMFGQSYVPWQTMDRTFRPCVGLKMGTIFPELVSPYMPGQSMEEIEFIRRTNSIGEGCNR